MKKRISMILATIILVSVTSVAFASGRIALTPKADNPISAWALDAVAKAGENEISETDKNYIFANPITREEFCELIYNLIHNAKKDIAMLDYALNTNITDTDNDKVLELYARGIINGKTETEFAPNDTLTREEAATIILRTVNIELPIPRHQVYYIFKDSDEISDWAKDGVQAVCNMGIMQGTGDENFSPKGTFTVEEAITALMRIYDTYKANEEINDIHVSETSLTFTDNMDMQMPKDKNYMFSPLSIKMALALASNGASGTTQTEILNVLGITDIDEFNKLSKDIIARYSQTDILSLNIANSIWMNKDKTSQKFSDNFTGIATKFYNADVNTVTNANAVKEINSWVKNKTNDKIPTIIESADDFWAMLINAVYFKGAWVDEFSVNATKPDEFASADGTKAEIDFMNATRWIPYAETKSSKIIEMPYKNRLDKISAEGEYLGTENFDNIDVSMYLIMADDDISAERELNNAIKDGQFERTYIKLSVPKFKIEYETSLNDSLKNLGISSAFSETNAEFEKMFDSGNMWFTNTIHKTFINVDEKGTEAAAVTAIGMAGNSLPPEPTELKFNKPFYFVIRDNTSGETLFMGKFAYGK